MIFLFLVSISCRNKDENKETGIEFIPPVSTDWTYSDSIRVTIQKAEIHDLNFPVPAGKGSYKIQEAVDKAAERGGGTVQILKGVHLSRPVQMKSNVHLFLEEGALLKFIPEPEEYPLVYTWFEGIPCMNYSSMIYARDQVNVKISGTGTIDGQGNLPVWKTMKYREEIDWSLLKDMEDEDVSSEHRAFGKGHSLRPDLITLVNCKNVEITGVTIHNAPYWTIHPILCENLTISHLNIKSSGYNQIGIAPESSSRVLIDNVNISGTDDGIRILAGRVKEPSIKPSHDIIIRNSEFINIEDDAIAIGSKVRGGVNRVFVSGILIDGAKGGLSILLDADYRGIINEVFVKDITAKRISGAFVFCGITNGSSDLKKSNMSNLKFEDLKIDSCGRAFIIDGSSKQNIYNISIKNSGFLSFRESLAENVRNLNLENVSDGGKLYTKQFDVEDIDVDELVDNKKDDNILDSDDIPYNELNELVKGAINNLYPFIPVEKIERIITKTGVNYEIELEPENSMNLDLLISSQGEIIRSEQEILYNVLPVKVIAALGSFIKTDPLPYLTDEIKKITVQAFTYYEIAGETREILFLAGISEDGSILEAKQKQITDSFYKLNEKK
ncbi:MAG: glycosyl hydrolase family 28 protein [Bacteroidales bacterium]|nr:glycosyl hydrolase family 28 protein [Bacteroidales bacterium]